MNHPKKVSRKKLVAQIKVLQGTIEAQALIQNMSLAVWEAQKQAIISSFSGKCYTCKHGEQEGIVMHPNIRLDNEPS